MIISSLCSVPGPVHPRGQPDQAEERALCPWMCLPGTEEKEKFGRESAKPPYWKTTYFRTS